MSEGAWINVPDWWDGFARRKRFVLSVLSAASHLDCLPLHVPDKLNVAALVERLQVELPKLTEEFPAGALIFGVRFLPACWAWEINAVHPSFEPVAEGCEAPLADIHWKA